MKSWWITRPVTWMTSGNETDGSRYSTTLIRLRIWVEDFLPTTPTIQRNIRFPGDVLTKIPPRQHVLFWADNEPFNGTFHVNFKLDPTKDNYIALYENDGKTLLDEIVIPAGLPTDKTYGYPTDGVKYDKDGNYLAAQLERVTPSSNNAVLEENPKVTLLSESDPWGL